MRVRSGFTAPGLIRQPVADDPLHFFEDLVDQLASSVKRRIGGRARHLGIEAGLVVGRGADDDAADWPKGRVGDGVVRRACEVETLGQGSPE